MYPAGVKGSGAVVTVKARRNDIIRVERSLYFVFLVSVGADFLIISYLWDWAGGAPFNAVLKIMSWRECSIFRRSWMCSRVLKVGIQTCEGSMGARGGREWGVGMSCLKFIVILHQIKTQLLHHMYKKLFCKNQHHYWDLSMQRSVQAIVAVYSTSYTF